MTDVAGAVGRIVASSLRARTVAELLEEAASALRADGVPLWRAHIAFPTVNPEIRAVNSVWREDLGATSERFAHGTLEGAFERSPFPGMLGRGESVRRWRFCDGEDPGNFAILCEMRDAGATEYLANLVSFAEGSGGVLRGAAISFATCRPGGFTDAQREFIAAVVEPVALGAFRIISSEITEGLLAAYIGRDACTRVLAGEILRGKGMTVEGAIVFTDLSGFTAASEGGGAGIVARLDQHLEAMAAPIEAAGGAVLKFLGDGLLAGFALGTTPGEGCRAALDAALGAIARTDALNALHDGTPPLALKVALHRGEVFYGNVGGGSRLDFTVLGPAVNEASRMEKLCGPLGQPILMSAAFAACCGRPTVSLGRHHLRGIEAERELFGLAA